MFELRCVWCPHYSNRAMLASMMAPSEKRLLSMHEDWSSDPWHHVKSWASQGMHLFSAPGG